MCHTVTHSHQLLAEVLSYINLSYCLSSPRYFRLPTPRSLKNPELLCLQFICQLNLNQLGPFGHRQTEQQVTQEWSHEITHT